MTVLRITKLVPEEFFAEAAMDVARRELAWEVDYIREAENSKKFKYDYDDDNCSDDSDDDDN